LGKIIHPKDIGNPNPKRDKNYYVLFLLLTYSHYEFLNTQNLASERHNRIDELLWNESEGLYFDYNFQTGKQSSYEFATTFYPLWAGLAFLEQAAKVVKNLALFEAPGGLLSSTHVSGNQ
jgi:neutral trehalase